ncbi:MAG: hypothetical protein GWP10_15890 [Nitrospiraceae bacterium]|nr:hypothetical protein [Nitrospiraceae bacterium]
MKGDLLGYRFGGTEESYVVPVTENADPVEAEKQKKYLRDHPEATKVAVLIGLCKWYDHPDGSKRIKEVKQG